MTTTLSDLLGIARRRLTLVLAVTALGAVVGTAVILKLPNVYEARSVVHIEQGVLPESFKKAGVLVPKLVDVIGGLRQEVLSRKSLRTIINDLQLYEEGSPDPSAAARPEGLIERLTFVDPIDRAREDIRIDIVKRYTQVFVEITVEARTPELAAKTANRVADSFSAKNHAFRVQLARDVQQFIDTELAAASADVEQLQGKMRAFREQHLESLPENEASLHSRMGTLWTRTEQQKREVEEAEAERSAIDAQIAGLIESLERRTAPDVAEKSSLAPRLEKLRAEEAELAQRGYTEKHPDRARVRKEIERLEELVAEESAGQPEPPPDSPANGAAGATARGKDSRSIMAALLDRGADEETIEKVREMLARIAVLTTRIQMLMDQQKRDVQELERLEAVRASLMSTRTELEKQQETLGLANENHQRLVLDRQAIEKFLIAEEAKRGDQLRTVEAAEPPLVPSEPKRLRLMGLVLFASLGLALGLAYLLELRKKKEVYSDRNDVETDLGTRVLAALPAMRSRKRSKSKSKKRDGDSNGDRPGTELPWLKTKEDQEKFQLEEQFNRLRHTIAKDFPEKTGGAILITSAIKGEGKSTVATGLALAFARSLDHSVLLVDADLRNPSVSRLFDLPPGPGLEEHIMQGVPLTEAIRSTPIPKLSVMCSSQPCAIAADLTESTQMRRLTDDIRREHRDWFVIFDAPPILPTPDPLNLSVLVDGVLLVVSADSSPRAAVRQAMAALPTDKLLGVILNRASPGGGRHYNYYYYGGSESGSGRHRAASRERKDEPKPDAVEDRTT